MGKSLSWRIEDKIRFGNCGKYLDEIVYFRFPESLGEGHKEQDSHFILNDTDVLEYAASGLELPINTLGYAILFTQSKTLKSRAEIETILWDIEKDLVPKDHPARYEKIAQSVAEQVSREAFDTYLANEEFAWNSFRKFVRWVSKEEFQKRALEARSRFELGDNELEIVTRWDLMAKKGQDAKCKTCLLSLDLEPEQEKTESHLYCYYGIGSSQSLFFDYISQFGNFSVLTNEYSIKDKESLRNIDKMRQLAQQHDHSLPEICDSISIIDFGEISVIELDKLIEELQLSREILESKKVSAMVTYDGDGKKIDTLEEFHYGYATISKGYRVNVNDGKSAISVKYAGPNIFNIPEEAILDVEVKGDMYTFYFVEVYRKNNSFIGKFGLGHEMELPLVRVDSSIETPFRGLDDVEKIARVEHTLLPAIATQEYGYLQRLFEKAAQIAKRFSIPIKFE